MLTPKEKSLPLGNQKRDHHHYNSTPRSNCLGPARASGTAGEVGGQMQAEGHSRPSRNGSAVIDRRPSYSQGMYNGILCDSVKVEINNFIFKHHRNLSLPPPPPPQQSSSSSAATPPITIIITTPPTSSSVSPCHRLRHYLHHHHHTPLPHPTTTINHTSQLQMSSVQPPWPHQNHRLKITVPVGWALNTNN